MNPVLPRVDVTDAPTAPAGAPNIDWDVVHAAVQRALAELAEEVERGWPRARSRPGETTSGAGLFSYRTFEVPTDHGIDPLVAGVDFRALPNGPGLRIVADLCGEESGVILYECSPREVAATTAAALPAGEALARELAGQAESIGKALAQPCCPPLETTE